MNGNLRLIVYVMFLIGIVGVAGCASTSSITIHDPITVKLSDFKSVMLDVDAQVSDARQQVIQLESEIIYRLRSKDLFTRVFSRAAAGDEVSSDLIVLVTIKELRKVSPGARAMLGALAGQGEIIADVQFVNASSDSVIAQATVEGKTSGGSVFAGTTPEAIGEIADEVVALIEENI